MSDMELASSQSGPSWFRNLGSGWATVLLTGLAATGSQLVAMSAAGLDLAPGARGWSSGGVVALIGGLVLWKRAPSWGQFKRAIWWPAGIATVLSFVVVGMQNHYDVRVVDHAARPATKSLQPTGKYDVSRTRVRICEPGDDYLSCVNAHAANYNSVCVGRRLTWMGSLTCSSMSDFVDEIRDSYQRYGYELTTGGRGDWGWPYLRLKAERALASNHDRRPERAHMEQCSFDLGFLKIGTCNRES